jgi:hypothetical protein
VTHGACRRVTCPRVTSRSRRARRRAPSSPPAPRSSSPR